MGTFLTTSRMNPALANRVRESLRRGRSRGASFDRRWTAALRLAALVGIALALISLSVLRKREDDRLEHARGSLLDAVNQKRAELSDEDMRTLDRTVAVLLRVPGPYEGDLLAKETRGSEAFSAILERPILYVRGPIDAFNNDEALRRGALLSSADTFVHCLVDPPESRTERALFERIRGNSDHDGRTAHVHRLYDLLSGIPLLQPAWRMRVKGATRKRELSQLEWELRAAKLDETAPAARARLILFVVDEPSGPGGITELDGERPHDVRVTLFALEQSKPLLRVRKHVDPSVFSDRGRSAHATALDACALSFDVREAVARGDARAETTPAP
jgi:hypothetical protein